MYHENCTFQVKRKIQEYLPAPRLYKSSLALKRVCTTLQEGGEEIEQECAYAQRWKGGATARGVKGEERMGGG